MNKDQTGWNTIELADGEHRLLREFAESIEIDPYDKLGKFTDAATAAWHGLSHTTRDLVTSLADGSSENAELCVTNLPEVPGVPPTPSSTTSWMRLTQGYVSEAIMITFMVGLGHPISYLDQRDGSIFHDIYPTRHNARAVSSQSSAINLGHHTEMFFHPAPPDFLMLHCLRAPTDRLAYTTISALGDIESLLEPNDRALLSEPLFALDLARLHGRYTFRGRPYTEADPRPCVPISSTTESRFRFEPELTTAMSERAHLAMANTEHAATVVARRGIIQERSLIIIDNRRAVHSRSPFKAHFDGSDRWLRRMMIGTAPASESGVIQQQDLELVDAWRALGARIEHIPYNNTSME